MIKFLRNKNFDDFDNDFDDDFDDDFDNDFLRDNCPIFYKEYQREIIRENIQEKIDKQNYDNITNDITDNSDSGIWCQTFKYVKGKINSIEASSEYVEYDRQNYYYHERLKKLFSNIPYRVVIENIFGFIIHNCSVVDKKTKRLIIEHGSYYKTDLTSLRKETFYYGYFKRDKTRKPFLLWKNSVFFYNKIPYSVLPLSTKNLEIKNFCSYHNPKNDELLGTYRNHKNLDRLKNLKTLKLYDSLEKEIMNKTITKLLMRRCEIMKITLPKITKLVLNRCNNIESVPEGIKHLSIEYCANIKTNPKSTKFLQVDSCYKLEVVQGDLEKVVIINFYKPTLKFTGSAKYVSIKSSMSLEKIEGNVHSLVVAGCENLCSFPKNIHHLRVVSCNKITKLVGYKSLVSATIIKCSEFNLVEDCPYLIILQVYKCDDLMYNRFMQNCCELSPRNVPYYDVYLNIEGLSVSCVEKAYKEQEILNDMYDIVFFRKKIYRISSVKI